MMMLSVVSSTGAGAIALAAAALAIGCGGSAGSQASGASATRPAPAASRGHASAEPILAGGTAAAPGKVAVLVSDPDHHMVASEMTVYQGPDAMLRIHADGRLEIGNRVPRPGKEAEIQWAPGPTVRANGSFVYEGREIARLEPDGTLHVHRTGKVVRFDVGESGVSVQADGRSFTLVLRNDGYLELRGAPRSGPWLRVVGADEPHERRTALLILASLFLSEHRSAEPAMP
jgi:hypothetical protein